MNLLTKQKVTDAKNQLTVTKGEASGGGKRYIGRLGLTYTHYYI